MKRRQFLAFGLASSALLLPLRRSLRSAPLLPDEGPNAFTGKEKFFKLSELARRERWQQQSIPEIMGRVGMELRGTPYVGSTLELYDDREVCSINLMGLDCVTLFENALAFARLLKSGKELLPEKMMEVVTFTRYRGGNITDYTSRLHYTTDWFHDNQVKKVVIDITKGLPGAERFTQVVNFMSTHPNSYRQLKANPALVPVIAGIEAQINAREMYYVPKEKVAAAEPELKTGDIVGITTTIKGIDCSHTGLCYRDEFGKLRLLHASLTKKEVTLDDELHTYLASVSKHTGIMVVRPLG
ncbi:MAG: DUF1460 domain-containing protein [Chlorobi bacterium]|nr:MAG: lipoprotein [Chlorobi bacterium OLB7]MBK8912081.1 DUF1460 domain-containing protein [Chlorobiota bacterium]MBX7217144.1 DUF1460 domain-containing protein [Candidatus Kapabacteria bacterium]